MKKKAKAKAKIGKRGKTKDLSARKASSVRGGTESVTRALSIGANKVIKVSPVNLANPTFNK
jgi:hypothetical protein